VPETGLSTCGLSDKPLARNKIAGPPVLTMNCKPMGNSDSMRSVRLTSTLLLAMCLGAARVHAQIPSFPGAIGFGSVDPGAAYLSGTTHYGGNVYHVTNLND
jgi:hypothetical protein